MAFGRDLGKEVFPKEQQDYLVEHAKETLKGIFDTDRNIREILVFGSATTNTLGVYTKGTHKGMDRSDIDVIFLLAREPTNKHYRLSNGMELRDGEIVTDAKGKWVETQDKHPIMCAHVLAKDDYYRNLDKPYPEGYSFLKHAECWYRRD